jgi:hypothetical protein
MTRPEAIRIILECGLKSTQTTLNKKAKKRRPSSGAVLKDSNGKIISADPKVIRKALLDYVGLRPDGSIDPAKARRSFGDEDE